MTQLALDATGPEPDRALSAWHTPPALARALVALAPDLWHARTILEPSAGGGAIAREILATMHPDARLDAVEIDPRFEDTLRGLGDADRVDVSIVDYLARPAPAERYDLAIANPPYSGGEEVHHLAKLLDESNEACVLLPARSLHGRERYERVWSRCAGIAPEWHLRSKLHCIARPKFTSEGGKDEVVLVRLSRYAGPCSVGWL